MNLNAQAGIGFLLGYMVKEKIGLEGFGWKIFPRLGSSRISLWLWVVNLTWFSMHQKYPVGTRSETSFPICI